MQCSYYITTLCHQLHKRFPQLQVFHMKCLGAIDWKLTSGAMPLFQSVKIQSCYHLVGLLEELWYLDALREMLVGSHRKSDAHARKFGIEEFFNYVRELWINSSYM